MFILCRQRYIGEAPAAGDYVDGKWVADSFVRFVEANQVVASNLAERINVNDDNLTLAIYIFTSLFAILIAAMLFLYKRAQFILHSFRKLDSIVNLEHPQVYLFRVVPIGF